MLTHGRSFDLLFTLACVASVSVGAWRSAETKYSRVNPTTGISVGDNLTEVIAGDYQNYDRTFLLVVHSQCEFCAAAMPFYGTLVKQAAQCTGTHVRVVSREPISVLNSYLAGHGLSNVQSSSVPISSLRGMRYPTVLLVNRKGSVVLKWLGAPAPSVQADILSSTGCGPAPPIVRSELMRVLLATLLSFAGMIAPGHDIDTARKALGLSHVSSALINFRFESSILGISNTGTGRLLYAHSRGYRLDRALDRPAATPWLGVQLESENGFVNWSLRDGHTRIFTHTPVELQRFREGLQRDVGVYLAALLLADADFLSYTPDVRQAGHYAVTDLLGMQAEAVIRNDRVQEVRYRRPVMRLVTVSGGTPSSGNQTGTEAVSIHVSDFRTEDGHTLPHQMDIAYEQGQEHLTITAYVLNRDIPATEFQAPVGSALHH